MREVLGRALRGLRREGLEIFTKVYWPDGAGPNETGACRARYFWSHQRSLRTGYRRLRDLYQRNATDQTTLLEETMQPYATECSL
jgi:hypothetical protein